jgi:CHAD domain-containing protein
MAFELDSSEDPPTNVKRMVCERADEALECLSGTNKRADGERIHTARKRFKEIRAALRLIRAALDPRVFRKENRTYRDAARPLSELRDARALIEALDALIEHFQGELKKRAFASVRKLLVQRMRTIRRRVIVERGALRDVQRSIRDARRRIDRWPLRRLKFRSFADGIEETYRSARRAMAVANDVESDECLHEWRKWVKYLRHQSEILRPIRPEAMSVLVEQAHELADLLGDDHDLAVMKGVLAAELRDSMESHERKALVGLIRKRRETLHKRAQRLGRKLFAEKPKRFGRRLRETLDAWA